MTAAALLLAFLVAAPAAPAPDTVTLLIRNGTVYDGSGSEGIRADVGVQGDRIVFIGDAAASDMHGRREIDAAGLVVTPGFIDPHTHAGGDLDSEQRPARENLNYLMQGVTTVLVGNDGGGTFDVSGLRSRYDTRGIGTNAAVLVGFGEVRTEVLGMADRAPTADELDRMKALVDHAMKDGAVGMSTGLFYTPQNFSTTAEVVELAKVAASYGGIYDSHLRDESSYNIGLLGSVAEAIEIGREAGIPVNISHIKALGVDVWGQADSALALIAAARAAGQKVTADQYPYDASGTSVGASLLPPWAQAGGGDSLRARMDDPATRVRLVADMQENLRRRNGPDAILITGGRDRSIVGKTLAEIARERGVDPIEAALGIIRNGGAGVGSFNMSPEDIETFMKSDFVMTGSDGSGGHPRKYGTFPKKVREFVLDRPVISMAEMVRKSSTMPAQVFGLQGRGTLAQGAYADIAVFDPATIRDQATFLEPEKLAVGMRYVLVNGVLAVDGGEPTHELAGKTLVRDGRPIS